MRDYKKEAVKHWSKDPCGAETSEKDLYTQSFFDEIERYRYEVYAPWIKKLIPFSAYNGKRILEVGVGMGTDHLQFARSGAVCYGIDLTPKSIEITKRRLEIYEQTSRLGVGDAERLAFADNSFDMVFSFGVLHHTPDIKKAVQEIYRVLRPGGEVWMGLYHRWSAFFLLQTLLVRGLMRWQLFAMGYRRFLAQIERSHDHDQREAVVLVRVYGKRKFQRLFRRFAQCRFSVRHLTRADFYPFHKWVSEEAVKHMEPWFGWYIFLHGRKPNQPGFSGGA